MGSSKSGSVCVRGALVLDGAAAGAELVEILHSESPSAAAADSAEPGRICKHRLPS